MKSINEYLLSKRRKTYNGFPKTPAKEDIVDFLNEDGFHEGKDVNVNSFDEIYKFLQTTDGKSYILNEKADFWIRIFKGGSISKENPIYTLQLSYGDLSCYIEDDPNPYSYQIQRLPSYEDFVEKINKHFGWE